MARKRPLCPRTLAVQFIRLELKIETLISKLHKSDFYLTARKYYFIVFLPFGRMTTAATAEKTTIRPFPVLVLKIKLLTWI